MKNKYLGAIFIIVSSIIGAGMLALPLVGAKIGYLPSVFVLIVLWTLIFYSALCILELSLALPPYKNHFSSMGKATLKPVERLLMNISFLVLLYSVVAAYISGGGSLLFALLKPYTAGFLPQSALMIFFTTFMGFFIFISTKAVDYILRFLMSIKGILLLLALVLLSLHIDPSLLEHFRGKDAVLLTLPIFLVTLAYSVIIPSVVTYVGNEPKMLVRCIFIGSLIPLILFIGWLTVTLGIIPYEGHAGFQHIIANQESIGGVMLALREKISNPLIYSSFDMFSNVALWASFLAIGLALFDYIADACDWRQGGSKSRFKASLLAFFPPLVFAIFFPEGFIYALNFTALAICTLELILPPLMVYRLRKQNALKPHYQAPVGNKALLVIALSGCVLFILSTINIVMPS